VQLARIAQLADADPETTARPFIKWVGGKRQLLPAIIKHVPKEFGTFHEPFLGGGAVFFALRPKRAVLSDSNVRLIRTYKGIRDDVEGVIKLLRSCRYERAFFARTRAKKIDVCSDVEVAAWFIYLNRTGFNGLYRVNRLNQFNVPFGRYVKPTICDADNLRACAKLLSNAELRVEGFETVAKRVRPKDFVYFDPPYVPLSPTSSFTSYTTHGFDMKSQEQLCKVAAKLKRRGVHVLLSNSASPIVRKLYADFEMEEVDATRMVNSRGTGRGKIAELLVW
jgi:DNA adenine methylase